MSEDWDALKALVADALDRPRAERPEFLRQVCGEDREKLLAAQSMVAAFEASDMLPETGIPASEIHGALDDVEVGRRIGRYELRRPLGSGGMASVFEAMDGELGRLVAVKLIHAPATDPEVRRRFQREARVLAMLKHPNITHVYDAGVDSSGVLPLAYLAMELVQDARTIDQHVREIKPSLRTVAAMVAEVAEAAHHGHQRGILHQDLKPGNILVDGEGRLKIVDFGIARLMDAAEDGAGATRAGSGTPRYMSPERLEDPAGPADVRSDVYSLGVAAREMMAASEGRPDSSLRAVLDRATARDREQRYGSASEFAADLRRWLAGEPVTATQPSLAALIRLFFRRRRGAAVLATALFMGAVVGVSGLTLGLARAKSAQSLALKQAARASRSAVFLKELLHAANRASQKPDQGQSHSISDLLAVGAQRVQSDFQDDPTLGAETSVLLVQAARTWGDPRCPEIEDIAYRCACSAYGEKDPRTVEAMIARASAISLKNPALGLPEARAAFERARRVFDPSDQRSLEAVITYLNDLHAAGRGAEADRVLEDARSQLDRLNAPRAVMRLDIANLANVPGEEQFSRGSELVARARLIAGRQSGEYFEALQSHALSLMNAGRLPELEAAARELADLRDEQSYSGSKSDILRMIYVAQLARGDLEGAEAVARDDLRVCSTYLTPNSEYVCKARGRLARVLLERGTSLGEAESQASQASRSIDVLAGIEDGWAIYHQALWSEAVRAKGDARAARDAILHRRAACRATFTQDGTWDLLYQAIVLASCDMDLGDLAGARTELCSAAAAQQRHNIPWWPSVRLLRAAEQRLNRLEPAAR